jgi:hypothetical protein
MFFKRILLLGLLAFLVIGLVNTGRSASYHAGWSQGYFAGRQAAGQQAAAGEDGAPAPAPYAPYPHAGWRGGPGMGFFPFWWGIGLFFKVGLFLLFLGLIGRFFRFGHWHRPRDKHWRHHHAPPWSREHEEPYDEKIVKA